jgi:E3 ubiquitin-protein ligase TRIP12
LYTNLINKWEFNDNQDNFIKDTSIYSIYLLKFLNTLNRGWFILYRQLFSYEKLLFNPKINQNEFVNNKLTAKANRQLQDPLVIMTGHLPNWLPNLMHSCQFLFPFETRLLYFNITGLDRDRALQKLLDSNADLLSSQSQTESPGSNERMAPKLDKKKKTISRSIDLIKQADLIISEFSINTNNLATTSNFSSTNRNKQPLLEIQYESEVGTGLGPTLEFYALVSLEIQKCDNEMWRGEKIKFQNSLGSNKNEFFFYSPTGLFPAPISKNTSKQTQLAKIVSKFKFFGKFAAKAIIDSRVMDIQLSLAFYKSLIDPESLYEEDLKYVDLQLYTSLETLREYLRKRRTILIEAYKRANNSNTNDNAKTSNENLIYKNLDKELTELENNVNALDLDFRYPGYENIELKKNGKDVLVTLDNLEEYIDLITDWTLVKGVQQQIEAFKEGFESILPLSSLKIFYAEELERLFCGSGFVQWDTKMLVECTRCDHGYTHDSKAVQNLFDIMSSFNADEQRQFLQFVTGSPRLPVGGLRSLTPPLTIVRKSLTDTNLKTIENHLPSVMTCVNYLKLPEYSSVELMRTKLFKAMIDGQLSFHLS